MINIVTLLRHTYTENSTIGSVYVQGKFICYLLEDTTRAEGTKIKHTTAIPAGLYELEYSRSPRFNKMLFLLKGVPMYSGIRIHAGNYPRNTSGCLLPGVTAGVDKVLNSRVALKKLEDALHILLIQRDTYMRIIDTKGLVCP